MQLKDFIGKKVKVIGDHPHKGKYGAAVEIKHPEGCEKPGLVIIGDADFMVFDVEDIEIVES